MSLITTKSSIKKAKPTTKGKKDCPNVPDRDGALSRKVDEFMEVREQLKELEGRKKVLENALKREARSTFFSHNEDSDRPDSTFELHGHQGSVKVTFQDRYYPITITEDTESSIDQIREMCHGQFDNLFSEEAMLSVSLSQVPTDSRQEFFEQVESLLTMFGATNAATLKETVQPRKDVFHSRRHSLFTPQENEQLHEVVSCTTSIR